MNKFDSLDAQQAESAFAKFTPAEHAELQNYLDERQHEQDRQEAFFLPSTFPFNQ